MLAEQRLRSLIGTIRDNINEVVKVKVVVSKTDHSGSVPQPLPPGSSELIIRIDLEAGAQGRAGGEAIMRIKELLHVYARDDVEISSLYIDVGNVASSILVRACIRRATDA